MNQLVGESTDLSLRIQIITGFVGLLVLAAKVSPEKHVLVDALKLETAVQFVEFVWYAWFRHSGNPVETMAAARYYDWVFTTPTMLVSTLVVMDYHAKKSRGQSTKNVRLQGILAERRDQIQRIVGWNWAMLLLGYLGETGAIPLEVANVLGFGAFYKVFSELHVTAKESEFGKKLWWFLVVVWGMYGVAAMLDPALKNVMFNSLDIIAKNFFGLYLTVDVLRK